MKPTASSGDMRNTSAEAIVSTDLAPLMALSLNSTRKHLLPNSDTKEFDARFGLQEISSELRGTPLTISNDTFIVYYPKQKATPKGINKSCILP